MTARMIEHGNRIKAAYILNLYIKKHFSLSKFQIMKWTFDKLAYDQETIIMKRCFLKMIAITSGAMERGFLFWKMELRRSKKELAERKMAMNLRDFV